MTPPCRIREKLARKMVFPQDGNVASKKLSSISNTSTPLGKPAAASKPARRVVMAIPGLKANVGAGDVVEAITKRLKIPTCSKCLKRKERLNSLLAFVPRKKDGDKKAS